jgi:hypothetical protein
VFGKQRIGEIHHDRGQAGQQLVALVSQLIALFREIVRNSA